MEFKTRYGWTHFWNSRFFLKPVFFIPRWKVAIYTSDSSRLPNNTQVIPGFQQKIRRLVCGLPSRILIITETVVEAAEFLPILYVSQGHSA